MSRVNRIPHDRAADAAAYAVGALKGEEAQEYRRHLVRCTQCRDELAAFRRVADALPAAVPQYPPPPGLRRRVLRAIHAEPRPLNPVAPRPRRRTRPSPGLRGAPAALATAVAMVLVVVGAVGLHPGRSAGSRVLAARVADSTGTAQLHIAGNRGELIVRHLPAPAAGRIYEVWLKRPTAAPAPTDVLFSVTADGEADVGVPADLSGVSEILVTQEPDGGSRIPTRPALIVAPTN